MRLLLLPRQYDESSPGRRDGAVLRTMEVAKPRLIMGLTAARRAAAIADRWRNMATSIAWWFEYWSRLRSKLLYRNP